MKVERKELIVIGAGPAGLSAAIEAARYGVHVTVFDENDRPGGQLFKQIHKFFGSKEYKAKDAVRWMEDLHLVDDRATAEQVVHSCVSKGYGLARAKQALYEKKIPKEYWEDALADYPDQSDKIGTFLRSRLDAESDQREIKRAVDALLRRGHSYSAIRRVLEHLDFDAEEFPEE